MSWRQWLVLLGIFTLYLLLGGAVFMAFETPLEDVRRHELMLLKKEVFEVLLQCNDTDSEDAVRRMEVWDKVADHFSQPYLKESGTDIERRWTFFNSFFVAFTVTTTIGYGHLAPSSSSGRLFCIAFALIGIPLNGILLATLGDYFGAKLARRSRARAKRAKHCGARLVLLVDVCLYLIPGLVVFLALPAALFSCLEGWNFLDSFYYTFVTLTTIGFGDLVAGHVSGKWLWMYHSFLVVWIMFGLGYLIMVINVIGKALKSSPVVALERKVAARLRNTRLRMGRDGVMLRKLVNELTVLRVKPVYRMEARDLHRTGSQPFLSDEEAHKHPLESHNAEGGHQLTRFQSDTALNDIDRSATFKEFIAPSRRPSQRTIHTCVAESPDDPLELLARLATVLCEEAAETDDSSQQEEASSDLSTEDTDDDTRCSVLRMEDGLDEDDDNVPEIPQDEKASLTHYYNSHETASQKDEADYALLQHNTEHQYRLARSRKVSINGERDEGPEREPKTSVAELYRLLKEVKLTRQNSNNC